MRRYLPFAGVLVVLLAGLLLQLPVRRGNPERASMLSETILAKRLPLNLSGGSAHDEPIATTEEMKKAVGELLNFNEAVYRIYQQPDQRLSVYVAWWEAGRMSPRLVATHTPDVCWPASGWIRDRSAEGRLKGVAQELSATGFPQGEGRVFVANGKPEYVVFWHKVGDEILSYNNGWAPPWWAWIDELWRGGLNLRKEQLFVRISSNMPLEAVWVKPEMAPLQRALLDLGLSAKDIRRGAWK